MGVTMTRKYIVAGVIAMLGLGGCQPIERGSFGPFKRSLNNKPHGYAAIEDPTRTAPTKIVERFEVRPGDCGGDSSWNDCEQDRERSELAEKNRSITRGKSYWYGWSLYVPEDYVNVYPTKVALGQFHQHKAPPVWMFQNSGGGYHLDRQIHGSTKEYYKLIDEEDLRGKWHHIEMNVKWSDGIDGFFKVWVNGIQHVDYSGLTMTTTKTYFKYGIYRTFMSRYRRSEGVDEVPGQVVLFANVRRARERDGLRAPTL